MTTRLQAALAAAHAHLRLAASSLIGSVVTALSRVRGSATVELSCFITVDSVVSVSITYIGQNFSYYYYYY